jgi:aspartate racemase
MDVGCIGVVGGMGPFTGVDLVDKIHQESVAVRDQEHLPVLLASYPNEIPDRGTFVLGKSSSNPAHPIAEVIRLLERSGATVAGIPCVTAHCSPIMDVVKEAVTEAGVELKLLSLIDETVKYICEVSPDIRRVGAISTTASFNQQVFAPALEAAGLQVILQDPSVQDELVNPAIFDPEFGIKSAAKSVTAEARDHVLRAVAHLRQKGAEAVILGCTELPLAVPEPRHGDVLTVDPTRALARALIREFAPEKLRPIEEVLTV